MLPTSACPNVTREVFLSGSQPLYADTYYQVHQVNRETGFLATVFTPLGLVEKRTFMVIPPEAQAWAKSVGISQPPTQYDTVLQPSPLVNAHFNSPQMFADLRGQVAISGSAMGVGFSHYRLEYGLGLNPAAWFQIGEDVFKPVEDGLLARWEAGKLNGLVALRLLVVKTDGSVESVVTQVLVDNSAPEISLVTPQDGESFSLKETPGVVVQVQVNDLNLAEVRIYVDDELSGDFKSAPFNLIWQPSLGKHTLEVVTSDRAGNQARLKTRFSVNN
jgi:hypothetical protein